MNNCQFCKRLILPYIQNRIFQTYFEKFNFYFAKPINELLANLDIPHVIFFKDLQYNDLENGYLKRFYNQEEILKRMQCLTDFYQDYKQVRPNLCITQAEKIIQKHNDKQIKLFYQQQEFNDESNEESEKEIEIQNNQNKKSLLELDQNQELSQIKQQTFQKKSELLSVEISQNNEEDIIISFETDNFDIYHPNSSKLCISQVESAKKSNLSKLLFDNQENQSQYVLESVLGDELVESNNENCRGISSGFKKKQSNSMDSTKNQDNKVVCQFDYKKLQEMILNLNSQKNEKATNEPSRNNIKKVIDSIISFNNSKKLQQQQQELLLQQEPKNKIFTKRKNPAYQKVNLKQQKQKKGENTINKLFISQEVTQNFNFKNCQMINIQKNYNNMSNQLKVQHKDSFSDRRKQNKIILQQFPQCNYNLISNIIPFNESSIKKKNISLKQNNDQDLLKKSQKHKQLLQKRKLNNLYKSRPIQKNDYYLQNYSQLQNDKLQHLKQYISQSIINNYSNIKYPHTGAQTDRQHENRLSQFSNQQQNSINKHRQSSKQSIIKQEIRKNNLSEKFKIKLDLNKIKNEQFDPTQKDSQRTQKTAKNIKFNSVTKGFWTQRPNIQQVDIQLLKKQLQQKQQTITKQQRNTITTFSKEKTDFNLTQKIQLIQQQYRQDYINKQKCLTHRQQKTVSSQKDNNNYKNLSNCQQQEAHPPNSARCQITNYNVRQFDLVVPRERNKKIVKLKII